MVKALPLQADQSAHTLPEPLLPKHYKQTEVGVIPGDWETRRIRDLQPFVTSGSRGWARFYSEQGSPFIRITNLSRDSIYLDLLDLRFVSLPTNNSEGARTQLQDGDVLISITADIGIVGYVSPIVSKPAYINQHIALVRFDPSSVNSKFVSYYLASEGPRSLFRALTDSGAKAGMNLTTVQQVPLALPLTTAEQEAIANALSDADALIESLGQLITKKRQIKQGAMQELLTGKKRLPGFGKKPGKKLTEVGEVPEDWELKSIGEIAPLQRGFDLPTSRLKDGPYPVVYSNGVMNHHDHAIARGPGVVTGRSGTLGRVHFIESDYWPHNTALWVTRFYANAPKFVYYLYAFIGFERFGSGSGVPTLNRNDAHQFRTSLPPTKEEQEAIAAVLSDMDADIATLEEKLAKARQIKHGMMQELLTGRIRLV